MKFQKLRIHENIFCLDENEGGDDGDDDRNGGKSPQQQQQQTSTVGFDPADPAAGANEDGEFGRGHTGVTRAGAATKAESFVRGEGWYHPPF